MMKIGTFATVVALLAGSAAYAENAKTSAIVMATGMEGGGYFKKTTEAAQRLQQRGYTGITIMPTPGSDAITLAACNGQADVWTSQIDAIFTRFNEGCVLTPVTEYATENAFLLVPPDSNIDELSDLTKDSRVAVDGIGSGTELFWRTIVGIEKGDDGSGDDWSNAATIESSYDTLNTMANFGDIDAAVLVRKFDSDQLKLLLDQGWQVAQFWDKDINDQQFNRKPLYESTDDVAIKDSNGDEHFEYSYKVRSFVGVTKKWAGDRAFKSDVAAAWVK